MKKGKRIFMIVSSIILTILLVLSSAFICYGLYSFTGILTLYRMMGAFIILYLSFMFIFWMFYGIKKEKFKTFIFLIIISLLFSAVYSYGGYYLYNITHKLDNLSTDNVIYKSVLLTFNKDYKNINSIKNTKIGILEDETDLEGYILPKELIDKHKLDENNEIVSYASPGDLLDALYNEDLDLIFIGSNYVDVYGDLNTKAEDGTVTNEYPDLKKKAIEVTEIKKEYEKEQINDDATTVNEEKTLTEPFTMLVLGVDSSADGLKANQAFNGDTIMMITFNPDTFQATMFSIPRDTYVPVSCSGNALKKVNTSAYGGTSCVIRTMQNLTGIKIDYYVKVNFKGVVSLVDALGGIETQVPIDFCEQDSNRMKGANEICLKKGLQTLNGEQTLAFARNRYAFTLGDYQRGQNQQQIIEAMLNKAKSVRSVTQFMNIFDTVSKNIETNITKEQILSFYNVAKKLIFNDNINALNIQGTFLRGSNAYIREPGSSQERFAFFYSPNGLKLIVAAMKENLGLQTAPMIKNFSFDLKKPYVKEVIGANVFSGVTIDLVPDFTTYTLANAKSWAASKNKTMNIYDNDTKEEIPSSQYSKYHITSQSVYSKVLTSRMSSINIYASKTGNQVQNDNHSVSSSSTEESSTSSVAEEPSSEEEQDDAEIETPSGE